MLTSDEVTFTTTPRSRGRRTATATFSRGYLDDFEEVAELVAEYRFDRGDRPVLRAVSLRSFGAGLSSTDLARFPWARWLRVLALHLEADTNSVGRLVKDERYPIRLGGVDDEWQTVGPGAPDTEKGRKAASATEAALRQSGSPQVAAARPGRSGHPQEFYDQVASEWRELVAAGDPRPARTIADRRSFSLHTVNGWIKQARQLGLIPPPIARRGGAR